MFFQASLDPNGVFGGAGYAPLSIADFNGDGKIDVAGPALGNNVAVVLGNGDGTFIGFATASYAQASDFEAFTLDTADLRNQGRNDLVMFGQTEGDQFGEVVSLLGNGNGTFQTPMVSGSASMTFGGVLADLNGDGLPDAVALDYNQTIAALLGNGKGEFIGSIYTPSSQPLAVGVGDFNGDTIADIVVPGQVFLGNGDGTFGFPVTINAGAAPMVIGDVNGDGKTDIVQAGAGNAIEACLNNGNLSFTCISTSLAAVPAAIALADLNHDGKLGVVAGIGSQVQVLLGNGDGTFQLKGPFAVPAGTSSIAVADINGDGVLDLAFGGVGVSVLLGNGDGTFQSAVTYDGRGNVVARDFNVDGKIDLATFYGSFDIALLFNTVGLTPTAVVNPVALTFLSQAVNTNSPAQKVTLQNTGGASLSITKIAVSGSNSGDFNQTNTCGSSLAENASCTISVAFTPAAAGTRTGMLTISDSAGNQIVNLTGIGASLVLGVASGGSDSATVRASSTATYTLSIGGGGVSGTATLSCTGAPPGATCSVPGSVNVSDTQASNFTVSVSTMARSTASLQRRALAFPWFWATAMIGLVWLPGERRARPVARRITGIASLLLLVLLASRGGNGSNGGGLGSGGTPAGTYKLTIAATIGTIRQAQILTLTVQ